ncbi:hypothetical protein HRbin40_02365 [bacterium HR40]|nr:hypothetical protein HRbin40_02365 [bacterium HR40]
MGGAGIAVLLAVLLAVDGARALELEELPEGPGREEAFYTCSACHAFALVAQQGLSRDRWEGIIVRMIEEQGMEPPSEEERQLILDYLATWFGPERAFRKRGG